MTCFNTTITLIQYLTHNFCSLKREKGIRLTCEVEVGGQLAVGQCKPDEPETHAESGRDVGQVVAFTWNGERTMF